MTKTELENKLRRLKHWRPDLSLEPFEWLTEDGPPEAFAPVSAFMLVDPAAEAPRGAAARNWEPVLAVGEAVYVGAAPALLGALLAATRYFAQPEAFSADLVFQMHRFALDFYDGCQVREEQLTAGRDELVVRGQAYRGAAGQLEAVPFETHIRADGTAAFTLPA